MKHRTFNFLLILLFSFSGIELQAQDKARIDSMVLQTKKSINGTLKVLDSAIAKARKNMDISSKELKDLQAKRADLAKANSLPYSWNSAIFTLEENLPNSQSFSYPKGQLMLKNKDLFKDLFPKAIPLFSKPIPPSEYNDLFPTIQKGDTTEVFFEKRRILPSKPDNGNKIEKTKKISKSYAVTKDDKLAIDNKFGKIIINTWDKNEIKVDVEIKAYGNSESAVQKLLDEVNISNTKEGNLISFKTTIQSQSSSKNADERVHLPIFGLLGIDYGYGFDKVPGLPGATAQARELKMSQTIEITYTVYMPVKNALEISNRYGSISVPDFEGVLTVNSSSGNLTARNLSNSANNINVKFGEAKIENLQSGFLEVAYGSLDLTSAEKINAKISYSNAKIGKLSGNSTLNLKFQGTPLTKSDLKEFQGVQIERIEQSVKKLNIESSYCPLSLSFDPAAKFNFDVTGRQLIFTYNKSKATIFSVREDKSSYRAINSYKGSYGKGAESQVTIRSTFGSVNFL